MKTLLKLIHEALHALPSSFWLNKMRKIDSDNEGIKY